MDSSFDKLEVLVADESPIGRRRVEQSLSEEDRQSSSCEKVAVKQWICSLNTDPLWS
jgi:hypothetical protein